MARVTFMSSTISSLNANAALLTNAGSNVANLNTTEYKSIDTVIVEGQNDEVTFTTRRDLSAGSIDSDGQETSNVDLAKEFTDMVIAEDGYSSSLQAIKVRERMFDDLMNIFAND